MERASITHAKNILNRFHDKKIGSEKRDFHRIMKKFYKIYIPFLF